MSLTPVRALVGIALLLVCTIVFAQCCPGDGKCPATQAPTPASRTEAELLQQVIVTTDATGGSIGAQFAELTTLGEKVMEQEGLDPEKVAPLHAKYFKTLSLIRYSQSIVGLAKFESEFIEDDSEYLEATRLVLKAQKALARAQVLIDELKTELTALAPQVPVPPVDE